VAASSDFGLHLLTKSNSSDERIFHFGGGLSGHHGRVTGISFCGGRGEDSFRYVASVSGACAHWSTGVPFVTLYVADDKMLMVWDLYAGLERSPSLDVDGSLDASPRPRPTAYAIQFQYPLTSVRSHPSTSRDFLVSDCRGSIFVTDWRSDTDAGVQSQLRHSNRIELTDPQALAEATLGLSNVWSMSADWRQDSVEVYVFFEWQCSCHC
jgi:hypothetical protein